MGPEISVDAASPGRRRARRWLAALVLAPLVLTLAAVDVSSAATKTHSATVYVTDLDLNTVTAINTVSHSVTVINGAGRGLNGPLGIAITPDGRTAYVTNSLGDTVTPIDLATSPARLGTPIRVGGAPAAVAITLNGKVAYVSNFNSNTVTPINLTTNPATPERPIRVGFGPWSIAVTPNGRTVCVSDSEGTTVSVINTSSRSVTSVDVGGRPQAIAINPSGTTAYVATSASVIPINLDTSRPTAGAPIAVADGPVGVAVNPSGTVAYTANNDDTVTPINLTTRPATPEAPVAVGTLSQPDGIAISPNGRTAFAANASDTVTPINLTTAPATPESPVQVGTATFGIAITPDQAPTAHVRATPAQAGKATAFDASSSTSPDGAISRYTWNFGDGAVKVTRGPVTTHVYAQPGTYNATVTETSAWGTSVTVTFTGQTVSNNGASRARATALVKVPASLQTQPTSGPPGIRLTLRDSDFTSTCRTVNVFFNGKYVGQTTPSRHELDDSSLVVPGDASLGHSHFELSCKLTSPWLVMVPFDVVNSKNHLSEFSVAMPSPGQLKDHLASATGVSLILLLISRLISAGFPSEWLDATYAENRERLQETFRKRFPRLFIDREAARSELRRFIGGFGIFMGFLVAAGLINSFLDPTFGWNRTTLWLFLGECLGVGIVTLSSQLPVLFGGLHEHRRIHLQVLTGGLVIAIVCVAASRAIGLSPGYCYGLIAVFLLRPKTDEKDWGRLHAISAVVVIIVSTAAFFLTVPVYHAATSASPSPFFLILDPALNVTFLGGFASLAFGMFPLPFLPGRHIAQWNRPLWFLLSFVGLVGFVAVLFAPGSGSNGELHHVGLIPLLVAFFGFAVLSLGLMLYFHYHPRTAGGPTDDEEDM